MKLPIKNVYVQNKYKGNKTKTMATAMPHQGNEAKIVYNIKCEPILS